MIEFHLDNHSGVAPYLQIVQQVKQALRLGLLSTSFAFTWLAVVPGRSGAG